MTLLFLPPVAGQPQSPSTSRDYLSFSAIRTFACCPLRYFFKYIAGLPEETVSSSLVFGAALHRSIEFHFRELLAGNPSATLADLMAHYRAEWVERGGIPIRCGSDNYSSLDQLATRMLDKFRQHSLAQPPGRILAIEEELRGTLIPGVPDLLARVDLIAETDDELIISDWKTSRRRWDKEQVEEAAEQLILYSELSRDFAPGKHVRIEFIILTKTREVEIERHSLPVTPTQVQRAKRIVEEVWRSISAGNFYPVPSKMNCSNCPFRAACRDWPG